MKRSLIILFALLLCSCSPKVAMTPVQKEQLKFERRQGPRPSEHRKWTIFVFAVSSVTVLILNSKAE